MPAPALVLESEYDTLVKEKQVYQEHVVARGMCICIKGEGFGFYRTIYRHMISILEPLA